MPKMESAMRQVFEIECKDKGFMNESVSENHQSCIKPLENAPKTGKKTAVSDRR